MTRIRRPYPDVDNMVDYLMNNMSVLYIYIYILFLNNILYLIYWGTKNKGTRSKGRLKNGQQTNMFVFDWEKRKESWKGKGWEAV